jgi:hypothetical protein
MPGRKVMMLTQKDRANLPPLYSQENEPDPIVWVKFFHPYGRGSWYATEFDGKDTFFGWVDLGYPELGYFSLSELQSIKGPMGVQGIERDRHFRPTRLSEVKQGKVAGATMSTLRQRVTKAAQENPELRPLLIPMLREAFGDEPFAGRTWDGKGDQKGYDSPPAPKNKPCYGHPGNKGEKPGLGETCYRLHNDYGSADSGTPGSQKRKDYNKRYREEWMDESTVRRFTCPDGQGGSADCDRDKQKKQKRKYADDPMLAAFRSKQGGVFGPRDAINKIQSGWPDNWVAVHAGIVELLAFAAMSAPEGTKDMYSKAYREVTAQSR